MVLSTQGVRDAWGPSCATAADLTAFTHWTGVTVTCNRLIVPALQALDTILEAHAYRPRAGTGCFNCRAITGGTKLSTHAFGVADDINPPENPYSTSKLVTDMPRDMVDEILAIRTNSGAQVWTWGGDWDGHPDTGEDVYDAMHYQIACTPAELATGINWATVGGDLTPDQAAQLQGVFDAAVETRDNVRKLVVAELNGTSVVDAVVAELVPAVVAAVGQVDGAVVEAAVRKVFADAGDQ